MNVVNQYAYRGLIPTSSLQQFQRERQALSHGLPDFFLCRFSAVRVIDHRLEHDLSKSLPKWCSNGRP
jgi:hypothetical protein